MPRLPKRQDVLLPALALAAGTSTASATWSILIADTRTGEIAVASATCVTGIDLRAETPVLISGVGAATGQSVVDSSGLNRGRIRNGLLAGDTPADILKNLSLRDSNHDNRQYGLIDATGGAGTFSGFFNSAWAGGTTGRIDVAPAGPENDIVYAVQGNLLAGPYVVDEAVQAIIDAHAEGEDLAGMLMRSMEGAFFVGGDGRCSCGGDVPACDNSDGSLKTADVGYMLIARTGDVDASSGFWDMGSNVSGIAITSADLDQNGQPDVVSLINRDPQPVVFYHLNTSLPGSPLVALRDFGTTIAPPNPTDVIAVDFTGDTLPDITILSSSGEAWLFPRVPNGPFAGPRVSPIPAGITQGVAGDFLDDPAGRLEVAAINPATNAIELFRIDTTPDWALTPLFSIPLTGAPADIITIPGGAFEGLAVVTSNPNEMIEFESDGTTIAQTASAPGIASPRAITAGDFNGDGERDLAAGSATLRSVALGLSNTATPQRDLTAATIATRVPNLDLKAGDLDGDGDDDLLGLNIAARSYYPVFNDNGDATSWTTPRGAQGAPGSQQLLLADLNNDGLPDFGSVGASANALFIGENTGAGPTENLGFAAGDYYLELNIPGQQRQDPDPVLQLRAQFDQWRLDTLGIPDAVKSTVDGPEGVRAVDLNGNPNTVSFTVTLVDHTGLPAPIDAADLSVGVMPGEPDVLASSTITDLGSGTYRVDATLTGQTGTADLRFATPDGTRDIVLLPTPTLAVGNIIVDLNLDNRLNIDDVLAFLQLFAAGSPAVDFSPPFGTLDIDDVLFFIDEFGNFAP